MVQLIHPHLPVFCTANQAGVTLSYLIGPLMVPQDGTSNDVRNYLWMNVGLAGATALLTIAYDEANSTTLYTLLKQSSIHANA